MAPSLPRLVFLAVLPILVIGFFFSVLFHLLIVALILALLAVAIVVRLAFLRRVESNGPQPPR